MINRITNGHWLAALLIAVSSLLQSATAAEFKVDPAHAFVNFRISHLGYSTLVGRFNTFAGNVSWDKSNPSSAAIELTVETESIDSNWAERDKHLRGEKFLDHKKFPQVVFKSTKYTGDASGGALAGTLTLHGVTKPITIDIKMVGEGDDPWGGYRAGFTGTTSFNRSDFGISENLGPHSDAITFDLYIEGIRQ